MKILSGQPTMLLRVRYGRWSIVEGGIVRL